MELYQGVNSFKPTDPKQTAIKSKDDTLTAIKPDDDKKTAIKSDDNKKTGGGTESVFHAYVCSSMEELQTSMEIDASVKASYSVFSADAKSKYLHSLNLTTNSVTVLIRAYHKSTSVSSTNPDFSDEALKLLNSGGVGNFVKKYGDSWVSQITKGGEFIATFTFFSKSKEEKQKVEASLDVKGSYSGVDAAVSLATKISNALKTTNVRFSIDRTLIGYTDQNVPDYSDKDYKSKNAEEYTNALIQFGNSLATKIPDDPQTLSYSISPYEDLLPTEINFSNVHQNRIKFNGYPGRQGWASMYAELLVLQNLCKEFREIYRFYGDYQDSLLNDKFEQIGNDIDYLYECIDKISFNSNEVVTDFKKPVSLGKKPILQIKIKHIDPSFLNGKGSIVFDDINKVGTISEFIKLTSVQIGRKDNVVYWLGAKYSKRSNDKKDDSITEIGIPHGDCVPTPSFEWKLQEDEFITSMHGAMGSWGGHTVVADLFFKTNRGNTYGSAEKTATQKWDAQPGELLIGFCGTTGSVCDCLQPVVLEFSPAIWKTTDFVRK